MGTDVKNTGSQLVLELQTTSPRSFLLQPMTARFSVLKNALSGRFNARDDSGLSKWQKSRHSSYSYPLWRFLRKIGCPVFGSWAGAALHKCLHVVRVLVECSE